MKNLNVRLCAKDPSISGNGEQWSRRKETEVYGAWQDRRGLSRPGGDVVRLEALPNALLIARTLRRGDDREVSPTREAQLPNPSGSNEAADIAENEAFTCIERMRGMDH